MIPQIICIIIFILVQGISLQPTNINSEDVNLSTTLFKSVNIQDFNKSDVEIDMKNINASMLNNIEELKNNTIDAMIARVQSEGIEKPSDIIGQLVALWEPGMANPEELTMYKHEDILDEDYDQNRGGVISEKARWPDGIIPYNISRHFTEEEVKKIEKAMAEFHKHTCIKFVPMNGSEEDFLTIRRKSTGCWSSVGRKGGKQKLNLQSPNCLRQTGTIMHELMHTVGFYHEHTRFDRDKYVKIEINNVIEKLQKSNFDKKDSLLFEEPYDFDSIMHYSKNSLSKNKQDTIIPLKPHAKIGQRIGFSPGDIRRIRKMYNCPEKETTTERETED